jgi:hypothetical protein
MLTLFRSGGWSMFVILAFGFVALGTSAYFALRPSRWHEGFVQWMSRALFWAIVTGICSDAAAVFAFVSGPIEEASRTRLVFEGLAESLSPGIVGFAFLAIVAMLTAVGRRRLDVRTS